MRPLTTIRPGHRAFPIMAPAVVLALVLGLGASGCAGTETGERVPTGTDLDALPRWTLELDGRIGSIDDPEQALTRIAQVLIGPSEELIVAQRRQSQIRLYDRGGALLRVIGGEGEGPGEFADLDRMGIRGDTLYAADFAIGRVTFFTLAGDLLGTLRWTTPSIPRNGPDDYSYGPSPPQVLLDDGSGLLLPNRGAVASMPTSTGPRITERTAVYLRTERGSEVVDTVIASRFRSTSQVLRRGGELQMFLCPWRPNPLYELLLDGRGVLEVSRVPAPDASRGSVTVLLAGPRGDTLWTRSLSYTPLEYPPSEVEAELESMTSGDVAAGRPAPSVGELESALRDSDCIPPTRMQVEDLVATQDGTIWLKRELLLGDSVRWQALDPEARPLGEVMLGTRETIAAGVGDLLVVTELDELDVPYVVQYRVVR